MDSSVTYSASAADRLYGRKLGLVPAARLLGGRLAEDRARAVAQGGDEERRERLLQDESAAVLSVTLM
jgi:hypothetical protein